MAVLSPDEARRRVALAQSIYGHRGGRDWDQVCLEMALALQGAAMEDIETERNSHG